MNAQAHGNARTDELKSRTPIRGSWWLWAAAGLLFFGVAIAYAWFTIFSRPMSPDEGYLMITIQSFLQGEPLYDSVFTQYGPLYYFYEWLVRSVLTVPLTHDATRMLGIVHWLVAAAVLGCAARSMTGSWLAGLFVFTQAMVHLTAMAGEPGHPQELVALLLALGMLAASREPRGRSFRREEAEGLRGHSLPPPHVSGYGPWDKANLTVLAIIAALLVFTKINAGIFFGFALALGLWCGAEGRLARGVWPWVLAGACAMLPLLLMWRHRDAGWCRNYIVLASSTITASWLSAQRFGAGCAWRSAKLLRAAVSFLAVCGALIGVVLLTGTSLKGVLDGLLLTPIKMPGVALLPVKLPDPVLINAVVALTAAIFVRGNVNDGRVRNAVTILKMIFGIGGGFCLIGNATSQLAFLLPWVWLVAVPNEQKPEGNARANFARIFLCLAAAWQGLQAYPIAGTQVAMATLFLIPAYGVCLADAFKALAAQDQCQKRLARLTPRRLQFALALAVIALLYVFANVWCQLPAVRRHYASLPVLDLPGSRHVRFDEETTAMYRELARYLEKECDTFVTYPGFNSLYFWTHKRPPTHLNSTGWGQLSHRQQEHILGSLRQAQRPLLVVVAAAADTWKHGVPPQIQPLVRSVHEDFREIDRIGRFIVFVPRRAADTVRRD